ncbi:Zinc finger C2H2-type [Cinara cedri]|uniref:Zinc finger C2H2-type n=1 Tax=Cinara cedri TaxID=506608 RepID=A0A5E4NHF2_9HEMI|nr:Zinc finger C2H2-type [Cinara cedri]
MEVGQSIKNSSKSLQFARNLEEIKYPNTQTIEIKKEYDLIDGCEFKSVITIENDPMELILHQKPKLKKKKYTCHNCDNSFFSKSMLKCHMIMHTGKKVDNENRPLRSTSNLKELKYPNPPTIEIKKEYDLIDGCEFESVITIENDPMELMLYQKPKDIKCIYTCHNCDNSFFFKSLLKRHLKMHTGSKVDNENCLPR